MVAFPAAIGVNARAGKESRPTILSPIGARKIW